MKALRFFIFLSIFTPLLFVLTGVSHAELIDNQDGTVSQVRNDGSKLMWIQDGNLAFNSGYCAIPGNCYDTTVGIMRSDKVRNWIDFLNSENYAGYNDWRLPVNLPVNGVSYDYDISFDGSTDRSYNITSPNSEMTYLYNVELGNSGWFDTSGDPTDCYGGTNCLTNTGPFTNLQVHGLYLSGTQYEPDPYFGEWVFSFAGGNQSNDLHGHRYSLAVRDCPECTTVVPEPISSTLFIVGGATLGFRRFRKKFKK